MQILMHEIGLTDTVDPLAGSYFIEATTNGMEQKIREHLERVEAQGGIVKAVAEGWVQAEVNRQAYEHEKRVRSGELKKVGVNLFVDEGEKEQPDVEFHPYREDEARAQIARLAKIRAGRDGAKVQAALAALRAAAKDGTNVMPAALDAAEAYVSVGEICGVLREVFGTYREPIRF
jgi:methylmalonyl-CoA mutase N-terminal domain/subunit